MYEDNGNKCGKCQNHDYDVLKKGHARDCQFKSCVCSKCRLLDARSDILQVISGKETKLKGTKKDPNCGFCQNHGIKILRKGHVRSCGYGQERHFRLDNCFDCEVHYIRNEVNRLQIKMRRAMKEDRTLSEEQRKTAREAITCDEVEKVCDMARLARKKRENMLRQQQQHSGNGDSEELPSTSAGLVCAALPKIAASSSSATTTMINESKRRNMVTAHQKAKHNLSNTNHQNPRLRQKHGIHKGGSQNHHLNQRLLNRRQVGVWRPWSQQQNLDASSINAQDQPIDHSLIMPNSGGLSQLQQKHNNQDQINQNDLLDYQQQAQASNLMMLQYAAAATAAAALANSTDNTADANTITTNGTNPIAQSINYSNFLTSSSSSAPSPPLLQGAPPDFGLFLANLITSNTNTTNNANNNNNFPISEPMGQSQLQDDTFTNMIRLLIQLSQQATTN